MSRSFKKTPGWCDRNPFAKRQANKRVRRFQGPVSNGRWYRKLYCSWEICDFRFPCHRARYKRRASKEPGYRAWMK